MPTREYKGELAEVHALWEEIQVITDQITELNLRRRNLEEDVNYVTTLFLATH